jgi:hypothetical protein
MARGTGSCTATRARTRSSAADALVADVPQPPYWWEEPSENRFFEGSKGDELHDWLARHDEIKRLPCGRYRFWHATPSVSTCAQIGLLRPGSLLEGDPKAAAFFAARDRELDPERDVTVWPVDLWPWQFETGVWASLRDDYQVAAELLVL